MGLKFEDVSPIAGIATGKGFMGDVAKSGMLGLLPRMIAKKAGKDNVLADAPKEEEATAEMQRRRRGGGRGRGGMTTTTNLPESGPPMYSFKKGGKVKKAASKPKVRGSGCAKRGVKKCKMY
jgi:hypothetical protein